MDSKCGTKESCSCSDCQGACQNKPGWFLPGEAEKSADLLGVTLPELFRTRLGVDYWCSTGENQDIYLLSPAVRSMDPGTVFGGDPRGVCTFFKDGRCEIHAARPHECREYLHGDGYDVIQARQGATARAWKTEAARFQIEELLGDKPESRRNLVADLCGLMELFFDRHLRGKE